LVALVYGDNSQNTGTQVAINKGSNGTSGSNNVGYAGFVQGVGGSNTGLQLNVGGDNNNSPNVGGTIGVQGSSSNYSGNLGLQVVAQGNNQQNQGEVVYVTGSAVENDGVIGYCNGAASTQNIGAQGGATGCTSTNYSGGNGNIGVEGNANSGGVIGAYNHGVVGSAQSDQSVNEAFTGYVGSSSNGALNSGITTWVEGNNNNSWTGANTNFYSWQANLGGSFSLHGQNSTNIGAIGQINDAGGQNTGSTCYGLIGACEPTASSSQTGVYGVCYNDAAPFNYGVWGDLSQIPTPLTATSVYYAVYGVQAGPTGASNSYAGYFNGDVYTTGSYLPSDPQLKENIADYSNALADLSKLPVKHYTYRTNDFPQMRLPEGDRVGILSTDLKTVFPNLVKQATNPGYGKNKQVTTYDAVNYEALIPILVEAVKEINAKTDPANTAANPFAATVQQQQAQIQQLTQQVNDYTTQLNTQGQQISDLKNMLNDICNLGCPGLQNANGNNQDVVLYQSIPNPTTGSATIGYVINVPFTEAFINVTSTNGNVLNQFKISQQGKGSITFDGSPYESGTFRYSLYIDGKLFDTKSIVITQK
jgi:hypothetical protein